MWKDWSDWYTRGKELGKSGRYALAARAFLEALSGGERLLISKRNVAEIHDVLPFEQGHYSESIDPEEKLLQLLREVSGMTHPAIILALNNLAATYRRLGHLGVVTRDYKRAVSICKKTLDETDLQDVVPPRKLFSNAEESGRKREVSSLEMQSLQIRQEYNRRNRIGLTISAAGVP